MLSTRMLMSVHNPTAQGPAFVQCKGGMGPSYQSYGAALAIRSIFLSLNPRPFWKMVLDSGKEKSTFEENGGKVHIAPQPLPCHPGDNFVTR